jgi:hypothetical protein
LWLSDGSRHCSKKGKSRLRLLPFLFNQPSPTMAIRLSRFGQLKLRQQEPRVPCGDWHCQAFPFPPELEKGWKERQNLANAVREGGLCAFVAAALAAR